MSSVTLIPATISRNGSNLLVSKFAKRRVAGYARVSTDKDDQFQSYEAQIDYYTNYIKSHEGWEFVKVYTDEGITGTSIKNRDGFKSMINDALSGKIDLIVTKSVSRFARNTVDSLTTIRQLKEKNIECYFEKENIWTFDGKGELLITIMSSLAQEEARSISENCTWGWRKRMADGKVAVAYSRFLGYDKGEDGVLRINPEEAEIIKRIYRMFLDGYKATVIAKTLTDERIPTPAGKIKWCPSTVKSILTNEKYKGDALLQKSYTVDFLTKVHKKNKGEVQQYYVKNSHEGIVSPEIFEMVQTEMQTEPDRHGRNENDLAFTGRIRCGCCGGSFSRFVWHSNTSHRKYVWHCTQKYMGKKTRCDSGNFSEEELKEICVREINKILTPEYNEIFKTIESTAFNTDSLEKQHRILTDELTALTAVINDVVKRNAASDENFSEKYESLVKTYEKKKAELDDIKQKTDDIKRRHTSALRFLSDIESLKEPLQEFDEEIFHRLVDYIEIKGRDEIRFVWKFPV